MRRSLKNIFSIFTFLVISLFIFSNAYASIAWQPYSSAVFEKAKKEKKLVLIYGMSETCHWCQKMSSESFTDPSIVSIINSKYIPVSIDVGYQSDLADNYNIMGTPTIIIMDGNKRELTRIPGYVSPSEFKYTLQNP